MAFYNRWSKIFLIGACIPLLHSCGNSDKKSSDNSGSKELTGQEIYEQRCVVCHGGNGDLGISDAADLSASTLSLEEVIYTVTNGSESGKMTPFKGILGEKDIDAVANYIETLKK